MGEMHHSQYTATVSFLLINYELRSNNVLHLTAEHALAVELIKITVFSTCRIIYFDFSFSKLAGGFIYVLVM